jgi:predicted dehydrogenase
MPLTNKSRRKFIKNSALASSLFIVPRHVLGGEGYTAPSDKLNIAGIGLHGKGNSDILLASVNSRENVIALCDVHQYAYGAQVAVRNHPNAKFYTDFRELLEKEDLDAVTITTPDHTHANISKIAMEKGIHVYVQKPLTHNVKEARMLTELARKNKIVTQMGNQGASNPEQYMIQKWIRDGRIGKVNKVYTWTNRPVWPQGVSMKKPDPSQKPEGMNWDLWIGPSQNNGYTPGLHAFDWRGFWEYGTGALGDMGCHIMDAPIKALGLFEPYSVEASIANPIYISAFTPSEVVEEACPTSSNVTYKFRASGLNNCEVEMTWMDGGFRPSQPDLTTDSDYLGDSGCLMIGENGLIWCGDYGINARLYINGQNGAVETGKISAIDSVEFGHQSHWIDAIKDGYGSEKHKMLTSNFDFAGPLSEIVLLGNVAIRSSLLKRSKRSNVFIGRKKLDYDNKKMQITNLDQANQFLTRDYREGWNLNI